MTDPKDIDAFLIDLMPRLGSIARDGFSDPGHVRYKSPGQPVTETDGKIEKTAKEAILATWPEHHVLGEESGLTEGTGETTWFIDPIDGTLNFTQSIPLFCISIGVAQRGKVVAGHVLDPLRGEHFHAVQGGGAWLGAEPVQVSAARRIEDAVLSMQTNAEGDFLQKPGFMLDLHRQFQKTRKLGTIALELAYVACGRFDLLFAGKSKPQAWWDIAGGWMLVEAAGGALADLDGKPLTPDSSHLVAGHQALVDEFLHTFRHFEDPRAD